MHDPKDNPLPNYRGRGSSLDVPNRFEQVFVESDFEQLEQPDQEALLDQKIETRYFLDHSESVVSQNSSPDIDFNYSLNPYRGCSHGCSYCYARPSHEFLGLNAGIDFESRIVVKPEAGKLFQSWLSRKNWAPEPIMLSGVTDPYQPCEKQFEITRDCLQVANLMKHPIRLITKNGLIRRDLDLLENLAAQNLTQVTVSLTSLDQSLTRVMEPRTSSPRARLETIRALHEANIPVRVSIAPIIPGINDSEIPELLKAAKEAGAHSASYIVLRLPMAVEPVFLDWLERNFPDRAEKIMGRIRSIREGKLNQSEFKTRMMGKGILAHQIRSIFKMFSKKYALDNPLVPLRTDLFRKLDGHGRQQKELF